ncbi:hypothetical protein KA005_64330 [bacterium]|nr:hypothetical protein [bacterium]
MRYFGRTVNPANRLRNHMYESRVESNRRARWIRSLSHPPVMKIVYTKFCTISEAIVIEKTILRKLMRRFDLTNSWDNCVGAYKTGRKVHQYSVDTGEYIKTFPNSNFVEIELGIPSANILRACKFSSMKYGRTAGGYFWLFYKLDEYPYKKKKPASSNMKSVAQYNMDGFLIKVYESAREASRFTGIGYKLISRVCCGIRDHTHNYNFKFI